MYCVHNVLHSGKLFAFQTLDLSRKSCHGQAYPSWFAGSSVTTKEGCITLPPGGTPSSEAARHRSVSACAAENSVNSRRPEAQQPCLLNRSLSVEAEEDEESHERASGLPKASSLVKKKTCLPLTLMRFLF
jgi:hypothetical protein